MTALRAATRGSMAVLVAILVSACTAGVPSSTAGPVVTGAPSPTPVPSASSTPGVGEVIPAPGSASAVYPPDPAAIVVAIDAGHGGCLDWGVPDPAERGVAFSEKVMTLGIALQLQELLRAQGVDPVMMRTDDSALAGDDYPALGCTGPAWRDVDGDGRSGFDESGRVRTRDELQARIDRANLARADILVSIHINSLTENGVAYEIAATQSFYDDETPWGVDASAQLANAIQTDVVAALDPLASYDRQDRGTQAVAYYAISRQWEDGDSCETPGDTWCKPHRAVQMPAVLTEVGSITLRAEQELLTSQAGQAAAATGIYEGIRAYLADRPAAVRYDIGGTTEVALPRTGPPAEARVLHGETAALTLTNRGTAAWPSSLQLVAGWQTSDLPYLPGPPDRLDPLPVEIPALAPGESIRLDIPLAAPGGSSRQVVWVTLRGAAGDWTQLGSPALQVANEGRSPG